MLRIYLQMPELKYSCEFNICGATIKKLSFAYQIDRKYLWLLECDPIGNRVIQNID